MNIRLLLITAVIGVIPPVQALAGTVTFSVFGSYDDSTTFSGSITYDPGTQTVTAANIVDSAGFANGFLTAPAQTYVGTDAFTISPSAILGCTADCGFFGFEFYTAADLTGLPYLDLYFAGDPATFTGGPVLDIVEYNGGADSAISQEVFNEGAVRTVIPEPASALLMIGAVAMIVWRKLARPLR